MATQNENPTSESTPQAEHPHHLNWLEAIVERMQNLDTEFPLSGGEDGHHHVIHHRPITETHAAPVAETAQAENKDTHHTSWLGHLIEKVQDLDTDFPLSGGEHPVHVH